MVKAEQEFPRDYREPPEDEDFCTTGLNDGEDEKEDDDTEDCMTAFPEVFRTPTEEDDGA